MVDFPRRMHYFYFWRYMNGCHALKRPNSLMAYRKIGGKNHPLAITKFRIHML